jgi:hypothetical protein
MTRKLASGAHHRVIGFYLSIFWMQFNLALDFLLDSFASDPQDPSAQRGDLVEARLDGDDVVGHQPRRFINVTARDRLE